jgi:hypothetical protein
MVTYKGVLGKRSVLFVQDLLTLPGMDQIKSKIKCVAKYNERILPLLWEKDADALFAV